MRSSDFNTCHDTEDVVAVMIPDQFNNRTCVGERALICVMD